MLPFLCLLSVFLGLCAEIERYHHRDDNHRIVRCDVTSEAENRKDGDYNHGDNGLDFDQVCDVLQDFHMYYLLNL